MFSLKDQILLDILTSKKLNRSSHKRCSIKKGVLKNFAKFTRKFFVKRTTRTTILLLKGQHISGKLEDFDKYSKLLVKRSSIIQCNEKFDLLHLVVELSNSCWIFILTHFSPLSHFYTPWKRQKTKGFLTFSGGIEMWQKTKGFLTVSGGIEMWHWTKLG